MKDGSSTKLVSTERSAPRAGRVAELDAIRGLAAVAVMLHHATMLFAAVQDDTRRDGLTLLNVFKYSPLHALFAGAPSVLVFFVLSGFVLSLSSGEGRRQSYGGFLVRRVSRIWVPYAVAVAGAMVLATLLGHEAVPHLSAWFDGRWQRPVGADTVVRHAVLVDSFDDAQYDPVIWSLIHEMRISLVFPLLVLATLTLPPVRALAVALAVAVAGYLASHVVLRGADTAMYALCFVVGILLAHHRHTVVARFAARPPAARAGLAVLALLLFTWQWWFDRAWLPAPLDRIPHTPLVLTVLGTASAAIAIGLAQVPGRARGLLRHPLPQFLGRISYSLYLVHTLALLGLVHLLGRDVEPVLLAVAGCFVAIALATLAERWVERPAQRLGRRAARRLEAGRAGVAAAPARP